MSAVNVPPERGRMEPSFDNKTIGSATLTDLCAHLIELQEEDDDPEETVNIRKILNKEWTVCVNKVLKQLLDKLQCRKCGVKPLELTRLLAHPHTIHPKLPKVLSEVRKLSRDPESILEGIGPEDHIWECFYEIECVWWTAHLNRDATFDSEGKVVTPEASQLRTEAQLHALAVPHPNTVLHRRRYLAKHGKLTFKEMMAEMERDSATPKPPQPERDDVEIYFTESETEDMRPSTTQRHQSKTTARNQSTGIPSRETTQAADPAVDRNLQIPPVPGPPSSSAYTPSRTQSSTGSLRQAPYPYPQPSGGQVNRPRIQATARQTQGPSPNPVSSVVPNMQLPAAFAEKEIKRRGRPRKVVLPALVSNSPQPNNAPVKTYRFGDNRGSLYAHTPWQKQQDALKLSKRTNSTPQSSEPPQRPPALGPPALGPAPTPSPRRQSSWEDPLGSEATRSDIQNQANFQSLGMTGQYHNQFRQTEQAANIPYQPIRRTMPPANPQTSSFPSELRFNSQPAPAQPQASPRPQRASKTTAEQKVKERFREEMEEDDEAEDEEPISTSSQTKVVMTDNKVSQSTSQDKVANTDNKVSQSSSRRKVRRPDSPLQLVNFNRMLPNGQIVNYTGLPGHRRPWENSDDDDSLGGSEYDDGSIEDSD